MDRFKQTIKNLLMILCYIGIFLGGCMIIAAGLLAAYEEFIR